MTPRPRPSSTPVERLIADLERAAKVLPRASALESESLLADLAARLESLGGPTRVPPELARRARQAIGAFSAAVSVMRANTDARLGALLHASRPPAGYTGQGRYANTFGTSLRSAA